MPWLIYTCLTRSGEELQNSGLYESVEQLDQELSQRGDYIIGVRELPEFLFHIKEYFSPKLQTKEVAEFATMLAMYVSGGVDLQSALQDMGATGATPSFKRVANNLRSSLNDGYSLSESMEKSRQFPDEMLSLCRIGEETGQLDQVLRESAGHLERVMAIKSSSRRAMIYPAFSVTVIVLGAFFWLTVVIPKVAQVFSSINAKLPDTTIAILKASDQLLEYWWLYLLFILATPMLFVLLRRNEEFRYQTDRFAWHSPVFGSIVKGTQMTFYFQYLGLMYRAGVPITQAIETLTYAMSNRFMRRRVVSVIEQLRGGDSLVQALRETGLFESVAIRMVAVGEETGNLDAQLEKLGQIYFNKVSALVDVLSKTMEPILIILMGLLFGFFLVAIVGPIYETIGNIGGM